MEGVISGREKRRILGVISKIKEIFQLTTKNKYIFILFFLYLFFVISNYIWLKIDTYPLLWDASAHFFDSLRICDLFKQNGFNFVFKIPEINREYPVFVPLITALFYNITGISEDAAVFISGSIFLGILIFSVYGISKNIYSKNSGLLAGFLVAAYPLIFGHSRVFMYDLPLTAMVSLCIYFYLVSKNFTNTNSSLIFGVVFGLGMLTKFTFFVFVGSALSYFFFRTLSKIIYELKYHGNVFLKTFKNYSRQILNFWVAMIVAIIIALTWYWENLPYLIKTLVTVPQVYKESHPLLFSQQSLFYYFFSLVNIQISFFLFLVFILGFCLFFKVKLKNKLFLINWILISYFVFTFISYKSVRYTLPYLPAIAIISAIGIFSIKSKIIKTILIIFIVIIATFQFCIYSFGVDFLPPSLTFSVYGNQLYLFNQKGSENAMEQHRAPLRQDWKTVETLDTISKFLVDANAQSLDVFIIPDDPRIHSPLISLAYIKRKPICFAVGSWTYIADSKADIVITKDDNWMVPPHFLEKINRSAKWFKENILKFILIKKIHLPDNSNLLIYKQN